MPHLRFIPPTLARILLLLLIASPARAQFAGCPLTGQWTAVVGGSTYITNLVEDAGGAGTGSSYRQDDINNTAAVATTMRSGTSVTLTTSDQPSLTVTGTMVDCDTVNYVIHPIEVPFTATRVRSTYCGDGYIDAPDEECDDGNFANGDDCTVACTKLCGNGTIDLGETCDDGNAIDGDGCSATCQPNVCGNGTIESGEQCDDANTADLDGCSSLCQFEGCPLDALTGTWMSVAFGTTFVNHFSEIGGAITGSAYAAGSPQTSDILTGTRSGASVTLTSSFYGVVFEGTMLDCETIELTSPDTVTVIRQRYTFCGDGAVQTPDELCDDGNFANDDACSVACTPGGCGNGVVGAGEECDDGNLLNGDGCTAACETQLCGNGAVELGETCDDGNATDGDGCSTSCEPNVCGNGTIESGEQCDDANTASNDGCSSLCAFEGCPLTGTWSSPSTGYVGSFVEAPDQSWTWVSHPDGSPATIVTAAGARTGALISGVMSGGFSLLAVMTDCDTIQYSSPASFVATRLRETYCGDGTLQAGDEDCDDGNFTNGDSCSVACTASSGCGNGTIDVGETCDDGNSDDHDACRNGCVPNVCGDGVVHTGAEACDDGNTASSDGCAADCMLEPEIASSMVGGLVLQISTDSENDGATAGDLVETTIAVPGGTTSGSVSITETPAPPTPPTGFVYVGTLVEITLDGITPAPTAASPVRLAFTIDASGIPVGQNEATLTIQKDGVSVANCTGLSGQAVPDPCVSTRDVLPDGDIRLTVLTTTASAWTAVAGICGYAPIVGCEGSIPEGSKLDVKLSGATRKLTWKWKGADAIDAALFGDPVGTGDQTLCVYDATGFRTAASVANGGTCAGKPCWKVKTSGFAYADKDRASQGVGRLTLKAGTAGKAKIGFRGAGTELSLPPLPWVPPVRVQLRSEGGGCFDGNFSAPTVNLPEKLKARSD